MSKTAVQHLESIRSTCGEAVYHDLNNKLAMDCRTEATHAVRKVEALMAVLQVCADACFTGNADDCLEALSQLKSIGVEPNK